MRKPLLGLLLAAVLVGPAIAAHAAARPDGPLVDVVEVSGVIDRPISDYIIDRIVSAERDKVDLLVLQMDSLGALKVTDVGDAPFISRLRNSSVPIGVWIGPRNAVAASMSTFLLDVADLSGITPSGHVVVGQVPDLAKTGTSASVPLPGSPQPGTYGANEALRLGIVDAVAPGLADFFKQIHGKTVETSTGSVTLNLPAAETTVRFFQPGPIKRLLHAFANPALVYVTLVAGALLLAFELFQPGFGVAGWTAGVLFIGAAYGATVLPMRWYGLLAFCIGILLLIFDVIRDEIFVPTALGTAGFVAGSLLLLPGGSDATRLSPWLIGFASAVTVIFFVPVMTWVRRQRRTIDPELRKQLVGSRGQVRSVLNPEGFVWIADELWRARTEDGRKMRTGDPIEVASVDGVVLVVRPA
jgi:membrane-bound serine protease (ClpP class)